MVAQSTKNRPIWSHWSRLIMSNSIKVAVEFVLLPQYTIQFFCSDFDFIQINKEYQMKQLENVIKMDIMEQYLLLHVGTEKCTCTFVRIRQFNWMSLFCIHVGTHFKSNIVDVCKDSAIGRLIFTFKENAIKSIFFGAILSCVKRVEQC